jgi:serine/threonine protein kinase
MELCEGNIADSCYEFKMSSIFDILRDMLLALDALHRYLEQSLYKQKSVINIFCSNNFVHLDIKPANILIKNGRYKLGDFGLALHIDHGKSARDVEEGDSRYTHLPKTLEI